MNVLHLKLHTVHVWSKNTTCMKGFNTPSQTPIFVPAFVRRLHHSVSFAIVASPLVSLLALVKCVNCNVDELGLWHTRQLLNSLFPQPISLVCLEYCLFRLFCVFVVPEESIIGWQTRSKCTQQHRRLLVRCQLLFAYYSLQQQLFV